MEFALISSINFCDLFCRLSQYYVKLDEEQIIAD